MDEDLIFIEAKESGERIDALLAHNIPFLSRNAVQNLIYQSKRTTELNPVKYLKFCFHQHLTLNLHRRISRLIYDMKTIPSS